MKHQKVAVFTLRAGTVSIKSQSDKLSSLRLARQFKKGCLPENWKELVQEVFQTGELFERNDRPPVFVKSTWKAVSDRSRAVLVARCVMSEGFRPTVEELS